MTRHAITATFTGKFKEPALSELAEAAVRHFTEAYSAKVEQLIAWAYAFGLDIAVSDGEVEMDSEGAVSLWYCPLEPGDTPPLGRSWRVYYCGRREPPNSQHATPPPPG